MVEELFLVYFRKTSVTVNNFLSHFSLCSCREAVILKTTKNVTLHAQNWNNCNKHKSYIFLFWNCKLYKFIGNNLICR